VFSDVIGEGAFGTGLHLSTFRLNVSAFFWDRGCTQWLFRKCLGVVRGCQGVFQVYSVSQMAQVELKSGRV